MHAKSERRLIKNIKKTVWRRELERNGSVLLSGVQEMVEAELLTNSWKPLAVTTTWSTSDGRQLSTQGTLKLSHILN